MIVILYKFYKMKKNQSFFASLFIIFCVCFTSCDSNDTFVVSESGPCNISRALNEGGRNIRTAEDELMLCEMRAYNDSILYGSSKLTRASSSNAWDIASADITGGKWGSKIGKFFFGGAGGAVGGLLGATVFSYVKAHEYVVDNGVDRVDSLIFVDWMTKSAKVLQAAEVMNLDSVFTTRGLNKIPLANIPSSYRTSALDFGMKHNAAMEFLSDPNSINYMGYPTTLMQNALLGNETFRSTLWQAYQAFNQGIYLVEENGVEDEAYNLFVQAFSSAGNLTQAKAIANRYSTMVSSNSSLASGEKSSLFNIFSLSVHSFDYWWSH